jgi:hypothetical protein
MESKNRIFSATLRLFSHLPSPSLINPFCGCIPPTIEDLTLQALDRPEGHVATQKSGKPKLLLLSQSTAVDDYVV